MIKITFPGPPVSQQRCRIFRRGNRICSFDPQVMVKRELQNIAKDQVHAYNALQERSWSFPEYPKVAAWFFMPIPKSLHKQDRQAAEEEMLKHNKKPDVDNLLKLYLDVLTSVVIKDDNAVELAPCRKIYSMNPRTVLFISETCRILTPSDRYESW